MRLTNRAWRQLASLATGLLLAGCAQQVVLDIPELPSEQVAQAKREVREAPPLAPVTRGSHTQFERLYQSDPQAALEYVVGRLQPAADEICLYLNHYNCVFTPMVDPDKDVVNATMDPRGTITVYMGLMQQVREAELASVVAHEMGHHILGHYGKGVQAGIVGAVIAAGIFAAAGGDVNSEVLSDAANIGAGVAQLVHSKAHEQEADLISAYVLANADYSLDEAGVIWLRLAKMNEEEGTAQATFLPSHPSGVERIAAWKIHQQTIRDDEDRLPNLKQ